MSFISLKFGRRHGPLQPLLKDALPRKSGRGFARVCSLAAGLIWSATPASALVGPAQEPGALARHVVMVLKRSGTAAGFCSGVVVAPDAVLTAAHCVAGEKDTRVHFKDAAGKPVLMEVAQVARHPGYVADGQKTRRVTIDLALVRTRAPLPATFAPATPDGARTILVGDRFRIAGFGLTREGDAASSGTLRRVDLKARAPLSQILLWTQEANGAKAGACTGDSGAPIFSADDTTVVAITAWANGGGSGQCGALTQGVLVGPQRAWVEGVLAGWR